MLPNSIKLFVCIAFFSIVSSAQQIGGGGSGKPLSASLGGLINANVFKKISQPKPKTKGVAATKGSAKVSNSTTSKTSKSVKSTKPIPAQDVPNSPSVYSSDLITFKPIANSGLALELAKTMSDKKDEQDLFLLIFSTVKTEYDKEAIKKGRKNDLAMALTFFIATCLTIYHDDQEPSDNALDNVYQSLADSMIENGNLQNSTSLEKQRISETLIYISGFVLFGYMNAKETNDAQSKTVFKQLAGTCMQNLMQVDPNKLRINQTGLVIR